MSAPLPAEQVDAAVFAGGEGRRIGGDKPMRMLAGRPLAAHVIDTLAPAARRVLLVGRTETEADALRHRLAPFCSGEAASRIVPCGDRPGLAGPVAALMGAADAATAPFLLTAPADAPFLPADLACRLHAGLSPPARATVAADARWHPTVALCVAAALARAKAERSLMATLAALDPRPVPFPATHLVNVNTADELAAAEARIAAALTRPSKA